MTNLRPTVLSFLSLACGLLMSCQLYAVQTTPATKEPAAQGPGPLDFTLKANDGTPYDLAQHKGKVVMLVNTASHCGYTKQYAGLEKLYQAHGKDGLVIIAVPANEFGGQEPGSNEEIKKFCSTQYPITFPLMAKVVVKGKGIDPLYAHLTGKQSPFPGDIAWNFTKFLIGRDGKVVARFGPGIAPDDKQLVAAVEEALKAKAPEQAAEKAGK